MKKELESLDSVLEIGPFHSPFLCGANIKYCDVLDSEDLKKRAERIGLPLERIPKKIDYVVNPTHLEGIEEKFDAVFSSHCVEHQPNLVGHFKQLSALLKPEGKVYLAIPDKRFCFDHFLPVSQLPEILAAYYEKREKHILRSMLEHYAFTGHNVSKEWWKNPGIMDFDLTSARINSSVRAWQKQETDGTYQDVHAWQFTPASFLDILRALSALGYIDLKALALSETARDSNEFYVILGKTGQSMADAKPGSSFNYRIPADFEDVSKNIVDYYENSRSWKVTEPLRRIMRTARKIKRRVFRAN